MSEDSPLAYWRVQAGIGSLEPGGTINSQDLALLTETHAVSVHNYTEEMSCAQKVGDVRTQGSGPNAVLYRRIDYPGEICIGCEAAHHCILLLIAGDSANLSHLPRNLAMIQEFK